MLLVARCRWDPLRLLVSEVRVGGFEVKHVHINPKKPHSTGNTWRVEKHQSRFLFIGPQPGKLLFTSLTAANWDSAIGLAREMWFMMDPEKLDLWYGPKGRYTK